MSIWLIMLLLLVLASLFVIYPFIGHSKTSSESRSVQQQQVLDTNLAVFRDTEAQLNKQLDSDEINSDQYQLLLAEAQQLLLSNSSGQSLDQSPDQSPDQSGTSKSQPTANSGLWLLPIVLLIISTLTYGLYHHLGASADQRIVELIALNDRVAADDPVKAELSEQLQQALEKRIQQRPENIYYRALLATQAMARGDIQGASDHYRQALEVVPNDGYLLAQYAESLFILSQNQFTPQVTQAIDRAFASDSSNPTILGLKGIQAFENSHWQLALTYWQAAIQQVEPNTVTANALQTGIASAKSKLQQSQTEGEGDSSVPTVKLQISIDPSINFDPEQSVFVALVATSGPAMPLAARKLRAGDLPIQISLSDTDALMVGHNLSSAGKFKAIARLSQTGSATPQSGDWEASSDAIQLDMPPLKEATKELPIIALKIARQRP